MNRLRCTYTTGATAFFLRGLLRAEWWLGQDNVEHAPPNSTRMVQ